MGSRARRGVLAACVALGSWGCLVALDFDGYDTNQPGAGTPDVAGFDGSLQGDFVLTATPTVVVVPGGAAVAIDVTINPSPGFAATVALTASALPQGVHLEPGVVIPINGTTAKVAVSAELNARNGKITLLATAGTLQHEVTLELVVRGIPGTVDESFGDGGIVTTALAGNATLGDMVVQADGTIVLGGGVVDDAGTVLFALARYTPDGNLDPAFGDQGRVTTRLPAAANAAIRGLAALPSAQVVAAGGVSGANFVARYRADGSLDPTFGTQGIRTITDDLALGGVFRRPTGSIVLAGTQGVDVITLLQLQASGTVDTTFADGGFAHHTNTGNVESAALGADGKVVVAGSGGACATLAFVADGSPEKVAPPDARPRCNLTHVAVDDAGYRAYTGSATGPVGITFMRIGLELPDGTSEPTAATFSKAAVANDGANDVTVDAQGRLLTAETSSTNGFAVRRLRRDLTPDVAFSSTGVVTTGITTAPGDFATAQRVRVQSDGRIIAAGTASIGSRTLFALVRYWP